jgi:hypothetical protein
MTRRGVPLGIAVLVAFVLAGGVIAAQLVDPPDPETLEEAIARAPMTSVAEIPAAGGLPARGVFVQLTSTGHFCLWDAPSARARERQGGCNSADDPLGGRPLSVSLAYDGGPSTSNVRDARLTGVTSGDVVKVFVLMSDGTHRTIPLRETSVGGVDYGAFGYRIRHSDLRKGLEPTAVVAVNGAGEEVDRQATGFGG